MEKTTILTFENGEPQSKIVLLEVMVEEEIVSCTQLDLKDYARQDKPLPMSFKYDNSPVQTL
jgi:hypothetical protein